MLLLLFILLGSEMLEKYSGLNILFAPIDIRRG